MPLLYNQCESYYGNGRDAKTKEDAYGPDDILLIIETEVGQDFGHAMSVVRRLPTATSSSK